MTRTARRTAIALAITAAALGLARWTAERWTAARWTAARWTAARWTAARDRLPVASIGGDFALTDHTGAPFTLESQRGKVVLIFFGYTYCPDVCPTTLSKLASVTRRLGDDRAKVKTLYITVDPERDTPEVLAADLESFDLDALGLTGTREAIDGVVKQYGASYEFVPRPESAIKYTVNHSTTLYALDTKGRVRIEFPYEATVDQVVAGIRKVLAESP